MAWRAAIRARWVSSREKPGRPGLQPLALSAGVLLILPSLLLAHARLSGSEPADGAVIELAPAELLLRFSEPVRPASLWLVDLSGDRPESSLDATTQARELRVSLPDPLPAGRYSLNWRVLASDGHVVSGSLAFTVTTESRPAGAAAAAPGDLLPQASPAPVPAGVSEDDAGAGPATGGRAAGDALLAFAARAVFLVLLLMAAGQALFRALLPMPDPLDAHIRRSVVRLALAGSLAALVHLQAAGVHALGDAGPLDPGAFRFAAASSIGLSLAVALPGFALLVWSGRQRGTALLLGGAVLLLASRALTGHPASREPGWLLMPAMVLHATCAAWWYGALWPLQRALFTLPAATATVLVQRYSVLALAAVALLVFAGLMMALVHLVAPAALAGTDYGRLLLGKLGLFALLLGMAAWHKLALTPRLVRQDVRAVALLRTGIGLEALLMTLLLMASVALTGSAPELPDGGFWR